MVTVMKSFCLFLIAAFVVLSARGVEAKPESGTFLQGLNSPQYHFVEAKGLNRGFHVYVRLPEGYTQARQYPAVYLLDGGITFPMLTGYYRYLSLAEELPDLIIVGISYGTDSFEEGNFRSSDFTAPSPERSHYGGAPLFQNFLAAELIPMIEAEYSADPGRRIIFGQSLGGDSLSCIRHKPTQIYFGDTLPATRPCIAIFPSF